MKTKPTMPHLTNPHSPSSLVRAVLWLKHNGISSERLRLLFRGVFESYRGEITHQLPPSGTEIDSLTPIQLEVASPSMVDQLPPSLFFDPHKKHVNLEKTELKARELFSPFDSMMAKIKFTLEYILLVYDFVGVEPSFSEKFISVFRFPEDEWNSEERFFWMMLLPGFHQWAGTKRGMEKVLSIFMGSNVKIKENQRDRNSLPADLHSFLGRKGSRLGSDWSLGTGFSECDSSFKAIIGPISNSQVRYYLPLGQKRKKLDLILSHCVPGQLRWSMTLKLKRKERSFSLGERSANCVLGYSTYLKN